MDLLDSAAVGKYLFQILGLAPHEVIHSKLRRAFGLIALAVEIRNLDYAYILHMYSSIIFIFISDPAYLVV